MPLILYAISFVLFLSLAITPGIIAFTLWLGSGQFTYVSALWIMAFVLQLYGVKRFIGSGMSSENQNQILKFTLIAAGSLGFFLNLAVVFSILRKN